MAGADQYIEGKAVYAATFFTFFGVKYEPGDPVDVSVIDKHKLRQMWELKRFNHRVPPLRAEAAPAAAREVDGGATLTAKGGGWHTVKFGDLIETVRGLAKAKARAAEMVAAA